MKTVYWVGSSLKDLRAFPDGPRSEAGFALYVAQRGDRPGNAFPLVGFGGAKVLEVVLPDRGDTFRVMYTVEFGEMLFVLHAFKKKSTRGAKTPVREMNLVRARLKDAEAYYSDLVKAGKAGKSHGHGSA